MNFMPLGENILISPDASESKSASGIIIASNKEDVPTSGVIVEISNEIKNANIRIGSKVFFNRYAGKSIEFNGNKYLIITAQELLGVMVGE